MTSTIRNMLRKRKMTDSFIGLPKIRPTTPGCIRRHTWMSYCSHATWSMTLLVQGAHGGSAVTTRRDCCASVSTRTASSSQSKSWHWPSRQTCPRRFWNSTRWVNCRSWMTASENQMQHYNFERTSTRFEQNYHSFNELLPYNMVYDSSCYKGHAVCQLRLQKEASEKARRCIFVENLICVSAFGRDQDNHDYSLSLLIALWCSSFHQENIQFVPDFLCSSFSSWVFWFSKFTLFVLSCN